MASKKNKSARTRTSSTAAKTTKPAASVEKVNKAFAAKVAHLKKLLTASRKRGAMATYAIACGVRDVLDGGAKYGAGAAKQLEAELGMDKTTLYRWAGVARAWPRISPFTKMVSHVNQAGLSISWSHLELLTELPAGHKRDKLQAEVLDQCYSVQTLRERIAELKGKKAAATETDQAPADAAAISTQVSLIETEQARLREVLSRLPPGPIPEDQAKALEHLRWSCEVIASEIAARLAATTPLKLVDNE
jgi:hypothetical protein